MNARKRVGKHDIGKDHWRGIEQELIGRGWIIRETTSRGFSYRAGPGPDGAAQLQSIGALPLDTPDPDPTPDLRPAS